MHPVLIDAFGLSIHSYGVMLAIGFIVGISLAAREAVRTGVDPEKVLNLTFWILISAIVGSRVFHCIVEYRTYLDQPLRIFYLWEGGLVFYGGFLGGVLATVIYTWRSKMNFWQVADILAPCSMIGLMFGRIGCFLAGCCFGKQCPADFPLGITFHNVLGLGEKGVPLYPTQPLSALNALIIFLVLWFYRKHKRFHGELLAICLFLYSVTRSLVELLRNDPRGWVHLGPVNMSESQVVSVALFLLALFIVIWVRPAQRLPGTRT